MLCITTLIGFLTGLVAQWMTPHSGASGFVLTVMVGIAGALAAAFPGQLLHWYEPGQLAGFAGAVVGTAILLVGYHVLVRER